MIQFALLYGLGFLSATLLVMVLASPVHRRIVRYTEDRLKATMPISPAEVRAQRDMARAVYAAENARTRQELTEEREKSLRLQLASDRLTQEAANLGASQHEMTMQIEEMSIEAADLRSRLRREEGFIQQLKEALRSVETGAAAKDAEIEKLRARVQKLTLDLDHLNINLSTSETASEHLKQRLASLRDEGESLRGELKQMTRRARDAEQRLSREEARVARLEEKLAQEAAEKADTQDALERRLQEIERLRGRAGGAAVEWHEPVTGSYPLPRKKAMQAERKAVSTRRREPRLERMPPLEAPTLTAPSEDAQAMADVKEQADALSLRSASLGDALAGAATPERDEVLRRELAEMAADMVALTAAAEGPGSPILSILEREPLASRDDADRNETDAASLAARTRQSIATLNAAGTEA
ncbi:hypothetical protein SAMN05880590_102445 [Rhizobium sp. RU35A]|uniref:hypothetical protein n=1 Tax=Rhizobium sp. RU35A TaxID=1907414 RepID=UPI000956D0B3|nr:hypothetical protein [Rhizobium sp. RU35A]SIQ18020.1 hypothetical protein SAMN05880590_102445 [Rhizobium sp. RU35A]